MKIKTNIEPSKQMAQLGDHKWSVARLIELSREFTVMEIPLDHLNMADSYRNLNLREMVMHMKSVNDADLRFPIIMDEDGEIMDGRHRIMKAILTGKNTIKAVRFEENPNPCEVNEG